ncbi:hypothetical protein [Thermoplasma acidophilum]|uniref:Uncharacterized protein n=1 Tax=Thermoplasma acidophilum (strain ATCC 25905 / DSM 1728 / JCM 9062 / NBRC 15155 / AMRC-C165) TaxID=273075 RepID=Q9HJI6_THEAC|nr:hypothetical protein [Thermoplasma acidophilum]
MLKIRLQGGSQFTLVGQIAENIIDGSEKTGIPLIEYVRKYTRYKKAEYVEIIRRGIPRSVPTERTQRSIEIFFNSYACLGIRDRIKISGQEAERIIQEASKRNIKVEDYLRGPDSPYIGVKKAIVI